MMVDIEFDAREKGEPIFVYVNNVGARLTPEFLAAWDAWYDAQARLGHAEFELEAMLTTVVTEEAPQ